VELPVKFGGEVAGITHNDYAPSRIVTPLFPEVKWAKETGLELVTTRGGGRYATSVGGTLAGGGAALIIVDDPLNARDAYSEPARKRVIEWYGGALVSRLNDKETGSIIAVMQRLHQDDLAGHLREDGGWDCLDLPAIALDDQAIPLGYGRMPPPARRRHPPSRARKPCGSRGYQSRNRQRRFFRAVSANADPAGRSDDQTRLGAPQRQEALQIIQSWDTAMKGGPANDWSVCTMGADKRWPDVSSRRLAGSGRLSDSEGHSSRSLRGMEVARRSHRRIGHGDWADRRTRVRLHGPRPCEAGSRQDRADGDRLVKFEAGNVYFPEEAPRLTDLKTELFAVPGSRHDDQCDSISQALNDERSQDLAIYLKAYSPVIAPR
jgi:hypothetical protein